MSDVTIFGFEVSTFVRTVRLACAEKGISYELDRELVTGPADFRKPEYLALHPFGRIPALRHDRRTVFETVAICMYLDGKFDGPALLPDDFDARIDMVQWTSAILCYLDRHVVRELVVPYAIAGMRGEEPDRAKIDAAVPEIAFELEALERRLAGAGPYFGGDQPFLPDMLLVPMLDYLETLPEGPRLLERAPSVVRLLDTFKLRPSHGSTLPERPRSAA